ncbi:MAG: sugar phosphate isomerase/epimerase [Verrucomicrobiae bacterium]|nr:sugar phosphate isomerase/epimerase [Verrucomicrobiae bacterium]
MRTILLSLLLAANTFAAWQFFPFCHDMPDARKRNYAEQAAMLKELGYDGVGHIGLGMVEERIRSLDAAGLKLFQITMVVNIATNPPYDQKRFKEVLDAVKGRNVQFLLTMRGGKPSDESLDDRAVAIVREMADLARDGGSELLLYPHTNDWVERIEDAVRIAWKVDRPNVGAMFNLCHWLRVSKDRDYRTRLQQAMPLLRAVSINGADEWDNNPKGWKRYIQPLDSGNFDIAAFLKTLKALGYRGSIGLQCYGIGGDAREHLARSMAAWKRLQQQLGNSTPNHPTPTKGTCP